MSEVPELILAGLSNKKARDLVELAGSEADNCVWTVLSGCKRDLDTILCINPLLKFKTRGIFKESAWLGISSIEPSINYLMSTDSNETFYFAKLDYDLTPYKYDLKSTFVSKGDWHNAMRELDRIATAYENQSNGHSLYLRWMRIVSYILRTELYDKSNEDPFEEKMSYDFIESMHLIIRIGIHKNNSMYNGYVM